MIKSALRSRAVTIALFVLAVILLSGGSIGAVQAAPRAESNSYRAEVKLAEISTALVENGTTVEGDDSLLQNLLGSDETFKIGKTYDEQLAVSNIGSIDEYVRVTVTKYWTDADGKALDLDPDLIQLHFTGASWSIDEAASTPERTVLYYEQPLGPNEQTDPFVDTVTIDGKVVTSVTKLADGTNEFDYEGVRFHVKATADAVQTHNGEAAMTSAWGRTI